MSRIVSGGVMNSPAEAPDTIPPAIIDLQIARGTYYSIKRETLSKFSFFRKLLLINPTYAQKISIDANQEVFPHIIAYLRRGTFPLLVDKEGRHDIPTYLAILEEAKHFQLDRLANWIERGSYAEAAKIDTFTTVEQMTDINQTARALTTVNVTIGKNSGKISSRISEEIFLAWGKRVIYRCPRGLHDGDQGGCGKKCAKARGGAPESFEEVPTLRLMEVTKNLVIDPQLCRDKDW